MTEEPAAARRVVLTALVAVCTLGFLSAPAAGAPEKLRDGLFRKPQAPGREFNAPPVARYVTEDGDLFTLDRTQKTPLIKFDDSAEVWALTPQPAPRGDVIYKDEMGHAVLRATRLGGITVFTEGRPNGQAVSFGGTGIGLRVPSMSAQALGDRLLHAAIRSGRATRRPISFLADASSTSAGLMSDTALVTSLAFLEIADRPDGRALLSGIDKVQLVEGKKPAVWMKDSVLWIAVTPAQGFAGRPSSQRILKVLLTRGR
jgi:hypothetical protein